MGFSSALRPRAYADQAGPSGLRGRILHRPTPRKPKPGRAHGQPPTSPRRNRSRPHHPIGPTTTERREPTLRQPPRNVRVEDDRREDDPAPDDRREVGRRTARRRPLARAEARTRSGTERSVVPERRRASHRRRSRQPPTQGADATRVTAQRTRRGRPRYEGGREKRRRRQAACTRTRCEAERSIGRRRGASHQPQAADRPNPESCPQTSPPKTTRCPLRALAQRGHLSALGTRGLPRARRTSPRSRRSRTPPAGRPGPSRPWRTGCSPARRSPPGCTSGPWPLRSGRP